MKQISSEEIILAKYKIEKIIKNLNSTTACFSGHRSQKLPWKFNEEDERCVLMKKDLKTVIENFIKLGYKNFLSGMAIGFDLICVETLLDFKKIYKDIKIYGILPCLNQEKKWNKNTQNRYRNLLSKLDGIRCIYKNYESKDCLLERNRYMINNSSVLIALFGGQSGGTKYTLDYAKKQGLKITILNPNYYKKSEL